MEMQKVMSLMKNDEKTTYPPLRSKNDFIKLTVDKIFLFISIFQITPATSSMCLSPSL